MHHRPHHYLHLQYRYMVLQLLQRLCQHHLQLLDLYQLLHHNLQFLDLYQLLLHPRHHLP
jgi:hypothetical protein